MTASTLATAALWSYGLAAAAYLLFALRVALRWRRGPLAVFLVVATLATAGWALTCIALGQSQTLPISLAVSVAEALRLGAWLAFLGVLLTRASAVESSAPFTRTAKGLAALIIAGLIASVALSEGSPLSTPFSVSGTRLAYGLRVGLAIAGLVLIEQLYRRAHPQSRWSLKPLCLALAGIFGFELFYLADALLFGQPDINIWLARGIANALVIPLLAISTARNTGWSIDMHLSRGAVFHSTALIVSGAFLLAAAAAGYYVRFFGGEWGKALQIELLFGAVLVVVLVASSGRFRSIVRVFVSKHFFSYRYDYREEWLRFTRTLSSENDRQSVQERVIMALADLVESPGGLLWLDENGRDFVPSARFNMPPFDAKEPHDGSLPAFLEKTGWVVDVNKYREQPQDYVGLVLPAWLDSVAQPWLIVPLGKGSELIGFVVLTTPRAMIEVDWEVRDLLKTASRQAASYIGQIQATEALLESQKFDAFNRMSAFVVHDLKNLVAQLSLLLKNAERHRDNPEFQRDMLATVEHVAARMNALLLQLRSGTRPADNPRLVEIGPIVRRVCAVKAGHGATIEPDLSENVWTRGHEERLERVIGHLVQNAIDATPDGGRLAVRLRSDKTDVVLEIQDSGVGMTPEFVRDRLFKPFETTKPAGMGIGMYESSQYVTTLGGRIQVESSPGAGTRVRVLLPLSDASTASSISLREHA
jgi:putative PEP-CTERM system histidine kinase